MTPAEWWAKLVAEALLFFAGCTCCGADRKPPPPLPRPLIEERYRLPIIPVAREADFDDEPEWERIPTAREADLFGIHARRIGPI